MSNSGSGSQQGQVWCWLSLFCREFPPFVGIHVDKFHPESAPQSQRLEGALYRHDSGPLAPIAVHQRSLPGNVG